MVGGDPAPRACHRAAIPAPKVFKYFIPVSHMTVTIVAPGPIRSARRNAAMTLAPVDVPAKRPSSRARRNAMARASSVETCSMPSATSVAPEGHDEASADAIDLVGARRPPGQDGRFGRLHGDDLGSRRRGYAALRQFPAAMPRCRRSGRTRRSRPSVCDPDLVGHLPIGGELVHVLHLVGPKGPGFARNDARRRDHVAGQLLGHASALARHDLKLCSEASHVIELLPRESIGRHDMQRIALHGADEGERYPGTAARVFDDRSAGPEASIGLGRFDHGERHAVLHASGRVLALDLQKDAGAACRRQRAERQERGPPDAAEDVAVSDHRGFPCICK